MGVFVVWMLVSMIAFIIIHGNMSHEEAGYSYVAVVQAQVSEFKPTHMYLLNCGGEAAATSPASSSSNATTTSTSGGGGGVISSDTRQWMNDNASFLISPSSSTTTIITNTSSAVAADPLSTARIFSSSSSSTSGGVYSFPVDPGRYWVRLYFSDLRQASQQLNLYLASFAVTATVNNNNGASSSSLYTLLFQFNPSEHTQDMVTGNNNIPYLYKEFSVNVITGPTTLLLSFIPSTGAASTYAYINAIEVVSMPSDLIPDTTTPVSQGNTLSPQPIGIPYAAMESIYRINVGGPAVDVMNDTSGLYRRWQKGDDTSSSYLTSPDANSDARQVLSISVSSVSYTSSLSMYVAPPVVYSTALISNYSDTTYPLGVNLSWSLPNFDPSYWYVIRLHFCDLQYTSSGKRVFDIFLQNRTAFRDLDIQVKVRQNQPFYWDFSIPPDADSSAAAATDLLIQAGPRFGSTNVQYNHAIVNGIEVWKLNNSFGSLDTFGVQGSSTSTASNSLNVGVIIGATIGGCFVVGLLLLGLVCLCRSKRGKLLLQGRKKDATVSTSWGQGSSDPRGREHLNDYQTYSSSSKPNSNPRTSVVRGSVHSNGVSLVMNGPGRSFTFSEMLVATHDFDESRILGVGGFGKVYLGELTDVNSGTRMVAVKRGSRSSQQGIVEFRTEIDMLSRLRHRHLVSLIGYCEERDEMILVYEYMGNGALRDHLYGPDLFRLGGPLTWKQRLEICIGATRGIHYLHTGVSQCIIHRDLKSTNILLDEKLVGKVADFGLSKAGPLIDQTHVSTAVKGSFGYLDPEYFRRQKLTEKSDVYSLGVVLLEVLCARPAINRTLPSEQVNIVEWVMYCKNQGMLEQVIDPYLVGSINLQSLSKYMDTVEKCLADEGVQRPTVGEVLWNLEYCLSLQLQDPKFKDDVLVSMAAAAQQPLVTTSPRPESVDIVVHSSDNKDKSGNAAEESSTGSQEDMEDIQMTTLFSQIVNPQGR